MYTIELNGRVIEDQSLLDIYKFKSNLSLIIHYQVRDDEIIRCTYTEFSKLAPVRRFFLELDTVSELPDCGDTEFVDQEVEDSSENSVADLCDREDDKTEIEINIQTDENNMDTVSFLNFASSVIPRFSGAPEDRDSFIENIRLVKSLATESLLPSLLLFVKGRMSGRPYAHCKNCLTIDEIIKSINLHFIDDPSDIIESKIDSLFFDNKSLSQFCEELEILLDKFFTSLMSEDIPHHKAQNMTIKKAVEACRKSSRNDLVKSVIASSHYSTHKEVILKFRTEIADQKKLRLSSQVQRPFSSTRYQNNFPRNGNNFSYPNNQNNSYFPRFNGNRDNNNFRNQRQTQMPSANVRLLQQNQENSNQPASWLANDPLYQEDHQNNSLSGR